MTLSFNKLLTTKEEFESLDYTNPYNTVAAFIHLICSYEEKNSSSFYEKLQLLMVDYQPISEIMKQNIKDIMLQNHKYTYIGKSYFIGSSPENDYTPTEPYQLDIIENEYSSIEEGYKRLFVKSSGADSLRPITVRLAKDGKYYIWSDSFMGLLSDIRPLESSNPWV